MSNIMGLDASVMPDMILMLLRNPEVTAHMKHQEIDEAIELLVRADAIKASGSLNRQAERHHTPAARALGDLMAMSSMEPEIMDCDS